MEDMLHISHSSLDSLGITQVTFQDFHLSLKAFQVFSRPGGEIIQDTDGMSALQEFFHDV
jgi:hypothetical protein